MNISIKIQLSMKIPVLLSFVLLNISDASFVVAGNDKDDRVLRLALPLYDTLIVESDSGLKGLYPEIISRAFKASNYSKIEIDQVSQAKLYSWFVNEVTPFYAGAIEDLTQLSPQKVSKLASVNFVKGGMLFVYNTENISKRVNKMPIESGLKGSRGVYVKGFDFDLFTANKISNNLESVSSMDLALKMVARGRVDFTVISKFAYQKSMQIYPEYRQTLSIKDADANVDFGIVFHPNSLNLCFDFVNGLNQLKENGEYEQIFTRWGKEYLIDSPTKYMLPNPLDAVKVCKIRSENTQAKQQELQLSHLGNANKSTKTFYFPEYPPFTIENSDGYLEGLYPDLLSEIYSNRFEKINFLPVSHARQIIDFVKGELDVFGGTLDELSNEDRARMGETNEIDLLKDKVGFIYNRNRLGQLSSKSQLKGEKAAVPKGLGFDLRLTQSLTDEIEILSNTESMINMVIRGRIDFAPLNLITYQTRKKELGNNKLGNEADHIGFIPSGEVLEFGMVFKASDPANCIYFVEQLNRVKESGKYDQIVKSWAKRYELENYQSFLISTQFDARKMCLN